MPIAALVPCGAPGCPELLPYGSRWCAAHEASRPGAPPPRATSYARGYDARWRKARLAYLARHPLCAECKRQGRTTAARVVDHVTPHRGDPVLFWDEANWQPLCDSTTGPHDCHGVKTGRGE